MKADETDTTLRVRPRPSGAVTIQIPTDTLTSVEDVARRHDMSLQALLRLYVGEGLRKDLAEVFSDRVLETTAAVLSRRIPSESEVSAILSEIRHAVNAER
jgi:hypothetical protein